MHASARVHRVSGSGDDARPLPIEERRDLSERAREILAEKVSRVGLATPVGFSFTATVQQLESEFGVSLVWVTDDPEPGVPDEAGYWAIDHDGPRLGPTDELSPYLEAIRLSPPARGLSHESTPPPYSTPAYLHYQVSDMPPFLDVPDAHAAGVDGQGVSVVLVDSGFRTRVTERHVATGTTSVDVDHPVEAAMGVRTESLPGVDYYGPNGAFNGTTVTLGTPLPAADMEVDVTYSCYHPHFTDENGNLASSVTVVAGTDDDMSDDRGHGTLVAAELLAVAPAVDLTVICGWGLDGFRQAVSLSPDIICCAWGLRITDPSQEGEIDDLIEEIELATNQGINIIFAGGNFYAREETQDWYYESDHPVGRVRTIVPPEAIAVGGAMPTGNGARASNGASSYLSFRNPSRRVPDVVGLVGERPSPNLVMLPTQPASYEDRIRARTYSLPWPAVPELPGDGTQCSDGWAVTSGTSTAVGEVGGVAALILHRYASLNLAPNAVHNVLEATALDITTGVSASNEAAGVGFDQATGWGLVQANAAINYLGPGFQPALRTLYSGLAAFSLLPWLRPRPMSPDIVVVPLGSVSDPEVLGLTVKHEAPSKRTIARADGADVFVRVENQGRESKPCAVHLYYARFHPILGPRRPWTYVVTATMPSLGAGEFKVAGPIPLRPNRVPPLGSYVFAAVAQEAGGPIPEVPDHDAAMRVVSVV